MGIVTTPAPGLFWIQRVILSFSRASACFAYTLELAKDDLLWQLALCNCTDNYTLLSITDKL